MYQRTECPDYFPWWVLTQYSESTVEAQGQLMNRRVSSEGWRIDAISGKGVKHEISFAAEACSIAGFKFQTTRAAATWPRGIRRWHADTRPATDCCKYASIAASSSIPKEAHAEAKAME